MGNFPLSVLINASNCTALALCWGSVGSSKPENGLAWPLMEPPSRYSVSPYYSFVNQRAPSFIEALKAIASWLRGKPPTFREKVREANLIEALAKEIEEEAETKPHGRTD